MKRRVVLCLSGVALAFAAVVGSLRSETDKAESLDELAAARVKIARRALERAELRRLGPVSGVEDGRDEKGLVAWSRRLLEAELDVSQTKAQRMAAAQANVDRMTKMHTRMQELHNMGRLPGDDADLAEYYLVEAKELLIGLRVSGE